jgi:hypothetical protein
MPGFKTMRRQGIAVSGADRVGFGRVGDYRWGTAETRDRHGRVTGHSVAEWRAPFRITTTEVENLPIGTARNFLVGDGASRPA